MTRKDIITALENKHNVKAKYLGAPSFAFEITINNTAYTVEKDGKIKNPSGEEIEFDELMGIGKEDINLEDGAFVDIYTPMEEHTGRSLRNLVNMIYSKESILKKVFEHEGDILNEEFVKKLNENKITGIEEFKSTLTGYENPGVDFNFEEKNIIFRFCKSPEKNKAYIKFIQQLDKYARNFKNASMKRTQTDNEKFAFRTWLIRLGFVGADFKDERAVLLDKLSGNGAYRFMKKENDE